MLTSQETSFVTSLLEWLEIGGPVVAILLLMSLVSLSISIYKILQFLNLGIGRQGHVAQALELARNNDTQGALALLNQSSRLADSMVAFTLQAQSKHLPSEMVREEVARIALNRIEQLRSHLRTLEIISAMAPLLGLFGTVIGMIMAFQQLESSASQINPALLSGGIWQALLTTAVGLAVAMPTAVALNYFERRIERFSHTLNDWMTQLFTLDCQRAVQASA